MKQRLALAATVSILWTACSGPSMTPSGTESLPATATAQARSTATGPGSPLPEPPEVDPVHHVATVVLSAVIDPATTLPTFLYDGQKNVAPTIRVNPGDTIVIDVQNALPAAAGAASQMNLHFHGLTVSPLAPADDVLTTLAMPGGSLHYVVPLPATTEPGLYWYHPHVHGETNFHVGESGMSGAIVVNGLQEHLPGLATMKERLMIVRDVEPNVAAAILRRPSPMDAMGSMSATSSMPMPAMRPNDVDSNPNPCGPDPAALQTTVNGVVAPSIQIAAGESQFFRVVNATGHKNLNLAVQGASLEIVAIDGVALDAYPGTAPTQTVSSFVLPPAARVEFVVTGTGTPALFQALCYNSGPNGDPDPQTLLATLTPGTNATSRAARRAAPPRLRVGAALPRSPLSEPLPPPVANRTVVFSEDNNGFYINNQQFSPTGPPMFTVHTGTVEQWQLVNITEEVHDFHIHQIHFLVTSINGTPVDHPHWADSVVVPHRIPGANGSWRPGYLTAIMDFRDPVIAGEFVFHCHILDHEDAGMMAKILAI